jgi:C_GCAxxG_C_C family probable redox protein
MNRTETAVAYFKQGFSCSQAVLAAFSDGTSLDRETALKVAGGFGGGIARMGLTCGAVTGAIMVIGLKHAAASPDEEAKKKTYQIVQNFVMEFKARNGSITCRELLKCDMSTPEGAGEVKRRGLINTVCPKLVADAAAVLESILDK